VSTATKSCADGESATAQLPLEPARKTKSEIPAFPLTGPSASNEKPESSTLANRSEKDPTAPPSLLKEMQEQRCLLEKLAEKKPKDFWDKFPPITSFLSTVLIAGIGIAFTINYQQSDLKNREQLRKQHDDEELRHRQLSELELVTKLLPSLAGDSENAKKQAYLTIKALGNTDLMTKLALSDESAGARAALRVVATSPASTQTDKELAKEAIDKISRLDDGLFASVEGGIVQVLAYENEHARSSTGFLWKDNTVVTALHAVYPAKSIAIRLGERTHQAMIQKVLIKADLALLRLEEHVPRLVPLEAEMRIPSQFEKSAVIGYSPSIGSMLFASRVIKISPLERILPPDIRTSLARRGSPDLHTDVIVFDGLIQRGMGGAPLVNYSGKVIGIVVGGMLEGASQIAWAIPADQLPELLKSKDDISRAPRSFESGLF
jgi:S1-C subfamily serine protease